MITGAMNPFRRWLTRLIAALMVCWFTALLVILAVVLLYYGVLERDALVYLACGLGSGIWLTALVVHVRWLRRLVWAFRYEGGVLIVRTLASWRARIYALPEVAGVEFQQGRGGYWYHRVVLRDGAWLVLEPGLENGAELAEQLRFDLGYAPFVPASTLWPQIIAIVPLGSGLLAVLLAGLGVFGAIRWQIVGTETVGTVTAFREPPEPEHGWIEVTYEVDGKPHVIRPANWNAGHGKPAYTVGETVPVLFMADRPEVGVVNNFRELGCLPIFLAGFGSFLLCFGGAVWRGVAKGR